MSFILSMAIVTVPVQALSPKVFTVSPSGGDDTANIQAAFNAAVAAGRGSTVKLTAGHFYCGNVYAENFRGTFKGAGRDLTVIDTPRGLDPTVPGLPTGADGYPFVFCFRNGDFKITDMTFDITAYEPAENWDWPWAAFGPILFNATDVIMILGNANSRVERVRFIGHEGTFVDGDVPYNVESTIAILGATGNSEDGEVFGGPVSGRHIVTDCFFEHVDVGVRVSYLVNGKMTITHSTIIETTSAAFLYDLVNSIVETSFNHIEVNSFVAIWCWQGLVGGMIGLDSYPGPLPAMSLLLIHHNTIHATVVGEAIDVWDWMPLLTSVKTLDAIIFSNDIFLDTSGGGICGLGVQDAKIINNRITGTAFVGIYSAGELFGGIPATGWVIIGNTFKGFTPWPDYADIWLDAYTSQCIVVARKGTTVLDEGINNIIIGAG